MGKKCEQVYEPEAAVRGEGEGMTGETFILQCRSGTGERGGGGGGERMGLRLKLSCDEEPKVPWSTPA